MYNSAWLYFAMITNTCQESDSFYLLPYYWGVQPYAADKKMLAPLLFCMP